MGRHGKPWKRKGRPGWFCEIGGVQHSLGTDKRRAELEFHRLRSQSKPITPGKHSLAQLVAIYLHWVKPHIKPVTYSNYYKSLQSWVDAHHDVRPADLRVYHFDQWFAAHPTWGPTQRNSAGRHIKTWSAWAADRDYLDADRLRRGKLPTALKREAAPVEDLERFEAAITDPHFLDYYHVLYDTGVRARPPPS